MHQHKIKVGDLKKIKYITFLQNDPNICHTPATAANLINRKILMTCLDIKQVFMGVWKRNVSTTKLQNIFIKLLLRKSSCENEQILDLEKFPLCEVVRLSSM